MFSDYLYDGSAFKPKQNHNPTDQARFVPFTQPGLHLQKRYRTAPFKAGLLLAVT